MVKPEWGQKRQCQSCAARFYDMLRSPIHCPKCGTVFEPEAQLKSRRRAEPKVAAKPKAVVVDELADDLEVEEIDDEDGDDVPELEEIDEVVDDALADDVTPEDALLGIDDDFTALRDSGTTSYRLGSAASNPPPQPAPMPVPKAATSTKPPQLGNPAGPRKPKSLPPQVARLKDLQWPEWKRLDDPAKPPKKP